MFLLVIAKEHHLIPLFIQYLLLQDESYLMKVILFYLFTISCHHWTYQFCLLELVQLNLSCDHFFLINFIFFCWMYLVNLLCQVTLPQHQLTILNHFDYPTLPYFLINYKVLINLISIKIHYPLLKDFMMNFFNLLIF